MNKRFNDLEARLNSLGSAPAAAPAKKAPEPEEEEDDDDVDLFGSDDEDEFEADRIKAERVAAYNERKAAKEAKKGVLIAKSNIILDVKPWDDETDMAQLEAEVRKIETDGLLWGAAKLVPVGYGIKKLQICCVVEDDKVGTDFLEENICDLEDYVSNRSTWLAYNILFRFNLSMLLLSTKSKNSALTSRGVINSVSPSYNIPH